MRIAAFGTFDRLHPGHTSFLKQSKKLGSYLLVVVARDKFVTEAKKKKPVNSEQKRRDLVKQLGFADKVILGSSTHNWFRTLRTHKIDILALGYDQKPTVAELKRQLRRHRLSKIQIVRLRSLNPQVYKSSKMEFAEK